MPGSAHRESRLILWVVGSRGWSELEGFQFHFGVGAHYAYVFHEFGRCAVGVERGLVAPCFADEQHVGTCAGSEYVVGHAAILKQ